uniref:ATP synthase complex subunit 8 n=1 Tax=Epinephelus polyphekadion TaxID=241181 RepID=A0A0H4SMI7_9TELE|nr:ATP synthase F0 subunit 8 [Epinephelus polyphekadion]AKP95092.1 ATP synthase subunit 8 [Epinephelus polyphekadion]WEL32304.1 ATP synthase F0 subunit 8 [Epinephelus polyphekadion]
MPQLLPLPWFATLLFAWMVFLIFFPKKVTAHTFPYQPSSLKVKKLEMASWSWPWV